MPRRTGLAAVALLVLAASLGGCTATGDRVDAGPLTLGSGHECIPATGTQPVAFGVVAHNASSWQHVELLGVRLLGARGVELADSAAVPLPDGADALGADVRYPPAPDMSPGWDSHVPVAGAELGPGADASIVLGVRLQSAGRTGEARAVELSYRVVDGAAGKTTGSESVTVAAGRCG